jgi:iron complex transport system substrate-binding protein
MTQELRARWGGLLAVSALWCLAATASHAVAEAPQRVASFNLCADQLVVALADPQQIAGLSPYAADPSLSVVAEDARRFPRLNWRAEATIALAPDLVFIGTTDRPVTRRMLRQQGLRVVETALVTDLSAAREQIRQVAALLGHPDRGEILIAAAEAARAQLRALPRLPYRTALVVERGGYIQGPDSLAAALVAEAGLHPPPGAPRGYGGFVPLEQLLMLHPDALFLKDPPAEPGDQGALFLTHPALRSIYSPERLIPLPTRYTLCGGPALVAAFDYLTAELSRRIAP